MAVDIEPVPVFRRTAPRPLFSTSFVSLDRHTWYDTHSDGERFLMLQDVEGIERQNRINIVLNWTEELKRLVPAGE